MRILRLLLLSLVALFSGHFIAEIPAALAADCPDLTIVLTGPSSAAPEQEIGSLMNATAENVGDTEAGQFALGFYLSTDAAITTSDTLLVGGREFEDGLAAGRSLSVGIYSGMQIPSGTTPGRYYLGVIVDELGAIRECDETNNTHAIPITIAEACPDLTIALTGPASAAPEEEIGSLMNATAENVGNSEAGQFALGFYLSTDAAITTSDTLLVGGREFEDGLAAGGSLSVGIYSGMQIPSGTTPGRYYLGVIVDELGAIDECDETNNTHAVPITIADQCPDLTIALTGPASAAPEEEIGSLMSATAENVGDTGAGQFALGFYLSTDAAITTSDTLLVGGREFEDGLAAGGSLSVGIFSGMQIPSGTTPGSYYLGVIVDELGAIDECDETNNTHAVPITIAEQCPDLTIALTGPASAAPEEEIGSLMSATAENVGDAAAGQFALGFYLSTDAAITTSDTLLVGGREFEDGLAAGGSLSVGIFSGMQIPSGITPGSYYLGVIVDELGAIDECDETNNTHAIPITIAEQCPDLTIALTGPASAAPEEEIGSLMSATAENVGDAAAGQFALGFYLSTDAAITTSDTLLVGGREFEDGLAAGGSLSVGIFSGMQIPSGITPGSYYLGVIVDELGAIGECDETNNTHAIPITIAEQCPDLTIALTGPASAAPEQEIGSLMSATAENVGDSEAGQFALGFYLSTDAAITTSDTLLVGGREFEDGLAAGGSLSVGIFSGMQIPSGITPGSYFLGVIVDELGAIDECDETNNTHAVPITIAEQCPDLTIELTGPSVAAPGEVIGNLLSATANNGGTAEAGQFALGFYLSSDETITTDDTLLVGGREFEDGLAAGASLSVGIASVMQIPEDTAPGSYYLGVIVDELGAIEECDETNNTHAVPITIGGECPDLFIELTGPASAAPEDEIGSLISATAENGGNTEAGEFAVGFYLSTDALITTDDILLVGGREFEEGLAAGGSLSVGIFSGMQIPSGITPGSYYLGVIVDELGAIEECDETNNTHAVPITIGESECMSGDLTPAIQDFSLTREGAMVILSMNTTVLNRGVAGVGEFSVGVYLFDKELPGAAAILFPGSRQVVPELGAGASIPVTISSTFEAPPGFTLPRNKYDIGIRVDDLTAVAECDETNNTAKLPLCEAPLLSSELKLHLPQILVETIVGDLSLWVDMNLVLFGGGFAFELADYGPNIAGADSVLCAPIFLSPDGLIHIPRMIYADPAGVTALSADLLLVPEGPGVIFEIVSFEILP